MIRNSTVIVGRKTYEEISNILSDPIARIWNAQVIVMSRDPDYQVRHQQAKSATSLDDALSKARFQPICVLGGAEIYREVLACENLVDRMELTEIDRNYGEEGVCFPEFNLDDWNRSLLEECETQSGVQYRFIRFDRK